MPPMRTFSRRADRGRGHDLEPTPSAALRAVRSVVVWNKDGVISIHARKRRHQRQAHGRTHDEWLTIAVSLPDVISMAFVPINSLLVGTDAAQIHTTA
jgi:hypothetical protein